MPTLLSRTKLRVMVDTTVLLAGIIWPRFPYEVLQHALRGNFQLVLCPFVLTQAHRKFREIFPAFTDDFAEFLVDVPYERVSDPISSSVLANQQLMRDITDIPVALAAIDAQVDYFVSDDKDFTDPNQPIHRKLSILQTGTFLNEVMGRNRDELDRIKCRTWADIPDE